MTQERSRPGFVQAITRVDATALVVGSMIGSGIFIVSAATLRDVGTPGLLLLVWALAGVVTVMGALTYGELAAMYPRAGGQYLYLRESIGPLFGYLYGWTLFAVIQTGTIAAVAVAFARFTGVLVPALTPDLWVGDTLRFSLFGQSLGPYEVGISPQRLFAILSIVFLTWVNYGGVRTAATIQTVFTAVKTLALVALIVLGLTIGRSAAAIAANFGSAFWPAGGITPALLPVIGAAMVGALFSMDSWHDVGFAGSELKNPRRDLPIAMALGVTVVTVLYLLANVAYLSVLTAPEIAGAPQDRVGTAALAAMFGNAGLWIMAVAIMISTFGCNNGLILAGARVYYAMARDRLFFHRAGELHPRHHTPAFALVAQAVWASVLCLSGTYSDLLDFVIFAAVLFYMLTAIGLFVLRHRRPDAERPVRAPLYPVLPGLYVIATGLICLVLLFQKPAYSGIGLAIVLLGVPVYFLWMRREVSAER